MIFMISSLFSHVIIAISLCSIEGGGGSGGDGSKSLIV